MTQLVKISEIKNLDEFRNLIRPIAQAEYDMVADLPKQAGRIWLNLEPEAVVAVTTDEFVRLLPKEYVKRSRCRGIDLTNGPAFELCRVVPEDVVMDTIEKMTTLTLGSSGPHRAKY